MATGNYVVGIDVGGQTTKIGVVDARGDVLAQKVIRSDIYGIDAAAYIEALAADPISVFPQATCLSRRAGAR